MVHGRMRRGGRAGRAGGWLFAAALSSIVACSFTTDLDSLDNGQCGEGTKACAGKCRSVSDPAYGCSLGGCSPCYVMNGVASCSVRQGTCAIASCNPGFKDCVNGYTDGCETSTATDPANCGDCGIVCSQAVQNGVPGCASGRCTIGKCNAGWADCDGIATNGCETPCLAHQSCVTEGGVYSCR
jgi:hypothetical protein